MDRRFGQLALHKERQITTSWRICRRRQVFPLGDGGDTKLRLEFYSSSEQNHTLFRVCWVC